MKQVLVLVEGQTEERFVKDVLAPYLLDTREKSDPEGCHHQTGEAWPGF